MSMADRAAAARAVLTSLMADRYDPDLILTGQGLDPAEIAQRVEIDDWNETSFDLLGYSIIQAFGEKPLCLPLMPKQEARARRLILDAVLSRGEVTLVRDDGITFYDLDNPDPPQKFRCQMAVAQGDGGPVMAGLYFKSSLFVETRHRGKGVGSDLVVEHIIANGGASIWAHELCLYSPGGAAAHRKAFGKLELLAEMEPDESPDP